MSEKRPSFACRHCGHQTNFGVLCVTCSSAESHLNRTISRVHKEDVINTMVEAQRLADRVVDLAITWHESEMGDCLDEAEALENAIDELLEFRRKMPIVKYR